MRLTIEQARGLARSAMQSIGHDAEDARLIADHLIDCELRGVTYGGLARAISIAERIMATGVSRHPIRVVKDTPVSASIDGGDRIGYVVAHRATALAIDKASASTAPTLSSPSSVASSIVNTVAGSSPRWAHTSASGFLPPQQ